MATSSTKRRKSLTSKQAQKPCLFGVLLFLLFSKLINSASKSETT